MKITRHLKINLFRGKGKLVKFKESFELLNLKQKDYEMSVTTGGFFIKNI